MAELSAAQRKLVEAALPVVQAIARRTHRRFREVPIADFVSLGHEAAVEAARTFNPKLGVPFERFAVARISGAMIREGTSEHFGNLHVIVKKAISAEVEPPPSELSLDEALDDTTDKARARTVAWIRRETAGMFLSALAETDALQEGLEDRLTRAESHERTEAALKNAIKRLAKEDRLLVRRHYRDGATFDTIAAELGVSRRTVVRMHDRIKTELGDRLRRAGVTSASDAADGEE
ncbi:MAG: sigma-70 family RNA polymerase sigma factor [Myxococcales bacterium]|nr:sigma-70 family RNA polymerase sigma factor [Myxococcales bacterium]